MHAPQAHWIQMFILVSNFKKLYFQNLIHLHFALNAHFKHIDRSTLSSLPQGVGFRRSRSIDEWCQLYNGALSTQLGFQARVIA